MFDNLTPAPAGTNQAKAAPGRKSAAQPEAIKPASPRTEDIFAEVDKSAPIMGGEKPAVFQPINSGASAVPLDWEPDPEESKKKFVILGGLLLAVLLAVGGIFYVFVRAMNMNNNYTAIEADDQRAMPTKENEQTNSTAIENNDQTAVHNGEKIEADADSDKDGLTDEEENGFGTSADKPDTDGDGLFDREEIRVYLTDPLNPDTDGDGYSDGMEVKSGNDPLKKTSSSASSSQTAAVDTDTDNDGLTDSEELKIKTYIDKADSDSDGLSDFSEVRIYGTNPLNPDTDGDSYLDGAEVKSGYNPKGQGKL